MNLSVVPSSLKTHYTSVKYFWVCVCACMNIHIKTLYIHMQSHLSHLSSQYVKIFSISLSKLTCTDIYSTDKVK